MIVEKQTDAPSLLRELREGGIAAVHVTSSPSQTTIALADESEDAIAQARKIVDAHIPGPEPTFGRCTRQEEIIP